MVQATSRGTSHIFSPAGEWKEYAPGTAYRCEIYLSQEGGRFVAATSLPGIVGHGESESDAIEDARKAVTQAIQGYKKADQKIPWQRREVQSRETLRVVVVTI